MSLLDLRHSSCQVDTDECIVFCRSHANVLLATSYAKLFRITTKAGKVHYVWRDAPEDFDYEYPAACRAFKEDDDLLQDDIFEVKAAEEIVPDKDVFCFGGYVYYLRGKPNGNLVIRRICAYSSQEIVERILADDFRDIVAESIYLANFYVLEDNRRKFVMTCWGIVYEEGFLYIPIFDEDRHLIYERPVASYIKEELPVGAIFKCEENGKYYQISRDERGKFYLNYASIPFLFNRNQQKTTEHGHTAKIINIKNWAAGQ